MSTQFLQKTLTSNDVGATGSHQAGIHVPYGVASFFPPLPPRSLNPEAWLEVIGVSAQRHQWRWIHYNNAVVDAGTRDEYRLTHTTAFLRNAGAKAGDLLELERLAPTKYRAVIRETPRSGLLVLSTTGNWRTVELKA